MRWIQYRLLRLFDNILPIPEYCWAFESGRSIPAMAALHVGKDYVVSMDLKDFFTHIKELKIRALLIADGYGEEAARQISELCTYKSFVPQGALTSPKISNYVTSKTFGPEIDAWCKEKGYILTVYADDITISGSGSSFRTSEVISFVTDTVKKHGFKVSHRKTKVMSRSNRQYVCGAVVNEKVNFLRKEKMKMRAMLYGIEKFGLAACAEQYGANTPLHYLQIIRGKLAWWKSLNPEGAKGLVDRWNVIHSKYQQDLQTEEVAS